MYYELEGLLTVVGLRILVSISLSLLATIAAAVCCALLGVSVATSISLVPLVGGILAAPVTSLGVVVT